MAGNEGNLCIMTGHVLSPLGLHAVLLGSILVGLLFLGHLLFVGVDELWGCIPKLAHMVSSLWLRLAKRCVCIALKATSLTNRSVGGSRTS